ncbi:MAG: tRNA uridine-5-carboxymethylaminomethyl(34) synthesis GTPase MnmE [Lachnospiraceae bacterium]|nr:tRNA uridine-5-carboxymethylaminomethyl(34) synthesis GTPase MnmE [Lachnospiraceae bacterium]
MKTDTIAAIATAIGPSGIGIIRISGSDAFSLISKIFKNGKNENVDLAKYDSHTLHYGYIYDKDTVIDEVLVSIMKAPKSYTTEDTVEINTHGGSFVIKRVLDTVIKTGVRPAEPGEFSKRAFLNGRMDLSEAQAVMDLISSRNEFARKNSLKNLKGSIKNKIFELREKLLHECAFIEAALDDPEHYSLDGYPDELKGKIGEVRREIQSLINGFNNGRILNEGIKCSIVGRPNVGKSSIFNFIAGEERAIVTDIPGTTRDVIETSVYYKGLSLIFTDTAGIRDTSDTVEKIGVQRSVRSLEEADLIMLVFDNSDELTDEDIEMIKVVESKEKNVIGILNKSDLSAVLTEETIKERTDIDVISVSAKEGKGFDELFEKIYGIFFKGDLTYNDEVLITNARQAGLLADAHKSLELVLNSIELGMSEDFFTRDIMDAYKALGEIVGCDIGDDLADKIFSDFCMGK